MWNKSKVYGYSEEYIREHGEPEDNCIMIESHESEVLTTEEIDRMFPCQTVGLTNVQWVDKDNDPFSFTGATVAFYHCDSHDAHCMQIQGEIEYAYMHFPSWMQGDIPPEITDEEKDGETV